MFTKLLSGVAFAAALAVSQTASAGHCGCGCHCGGYYAPASVPAQPAATPHHEAAVPPSPADTAQPPVASGTGRVIQRFSYEPGTEPAPQAAVTSFSGPIYRSGGPVYRSYQPHRFTGGLTGEARLHPSSHR